MSRKERDRLKVLELVKQGKLKQAQAGELLGLSERQVRRLVKRYREQGDAGMVHRLRGRPSNRRKADSERGEALRRIEADYSDFGPTLASEKLRERDGIEVSRETVRQWMIAEELWKARRRRVRHRQWRPRKECFGEMVQMDTSIHDWLEGRGEESLVLIAMIDDATSRILLRFYRADTTETNMALMRFWLKRYGRPLALYADKASHFTTTRHATLEEDLQGLPAQTQIGRALSELDIESISAHSPQAKGRVERLFGTLQDRLVKELRLAGISSIEAANEYLYRSFVPRWNKRFARPAASSADVHRSLQGYDLDAILSVQETRVVANDYTIRYRQGHYQIDPACICGGLRGSKVYVEDRLDGSLKIRFRNRYLRFSRIDPAHKRPTAFTLQVRRRPDSFLTRIVPASPSVPL